MTNSTKKSDEGLIEELRRELEAARETSIVLRARIVELEIKLERSERDRLKSLSDLNETLS